MTRSLDDLARFVEPDIPDRSPTPDRYSGDRASAIAARFGLPASIEELLAEPAAVS